MIGHVAAQRGQLNYITNARTRMCTSAYILNWSCDCNIIMQHVLINWFMLHNVLARDTLKS